jgi:glucose-6-phosphate isomerase
MAISTTLWPGPLRADTASARADLENRDVLRRILARDHKVWHSQPDEIANRLGWLDSPNHMLGQFDEIRRVVHSARSDGYKNALLLGMGGSSLAPEVFRLTFGVADGFLDLAVLDSTVPDAVLDKARALDPATTLYVPASKSGGTIETLSLLKYFYSHTAKTVGADQAGAHFAAITDPGSGLAAMAGELGFRHTFINDPDIGGRYSALSFFGLVSAGVIGVDLDTLLERARAAATDSQNALELGAFLGAGFYNQRDKLTLLISPSIASAGAWVEQLIAESTGKNGKGILPVDGEAALTPAAYGSDRLFVYMRLDDELDERAQQLRDAGHPLLQLDLGDLYDLGAVFYHWELATAIAGHLMDIHPFDQPNVEAAKILARAMVQTYREQGQLPREQATTVEGALSVYGAAPAASLTAALNALLDQAQTSHSYIALQAYLNPTQSLQSVLQRLRRVLQERCGVATTLGYGPRFLHSTGQLHKGDGGHGLFLQLTADAKEDVAIPETPLSTESKLSFGVLVAAQALGDRDALRKSGRAVLRIHLSADVEAGLEQLIAAIAP